MEHVFKQEQLPSGKIISRRFGGDGSLIEETHAYPDLAIGIQFSFVGRANKYETYFAKKRMVSRRTYEKVRVAYHDMPAADGTIQDTGAELLRAVADERRQNKQAAKEHQADPEAGRKSDSFCATLMAKGKREDAISWIQGRKHTLGERNWRSSKSLVDRLMRLGCVHIYVCEIEVYDGDHENSGHLVVELPSEPERRSRILNAIDRLASEQGYTGSFDNSQRYEYIKLD